MSDGPSVLLRLGMSEMTRVSASSATALPMSSVGDGFTALRPACMETEFGYIGRMVSDRVLGQAARFHGHLGPWLVLGLKAGRYARRKLGASPFDLRARVFCPPHTPYTCFVDGIQFSSGCTMGKGNVSHRATASGCRVEFARTGDSGRAHRKDEVSCQKRHVRNQKCGAGRVRLRLRTEVWDELHSRSGSGRDGAARLGREFARRRLDELFTL